MKLALMRYEENSDQNEAVIVGRSSYSLKAFRKRIAKYASSSSEPSQYGHGADESRLMPGARRENAEFEVARNHRLYGDEGLFRSARHDLLSHDL